MQLYSFHTKGELVEGLDWKGRNAKLPYSKRDAKVIVPIVKLGASKTYAPWECISASAIMIKVSDLLTGTKLCPKPILKAIKRAGGIHAFLGFYGEIIISPIMEDGKLLRFSYRTYAKIINALKVDAYLTLDAPTYHGRAPYSEYKLRQIRRGNRFLLKKCRHVRAIGLVKGSDLSQIDAIVCEMLGLGIVAFAFHTGDFLSRGSKAELFEAKEFIRSVRQKVSILMIYGVGSHRHLIDFYSEADVFITQSHFAYKMDSREKIMQRLVKIAADLERLEKHPRLIRWMPNCEEAIKWESQNREMTRNLLKA
jgi:hypothetical protein